MATDVHVKEGCCGLGNLSRKIVILLSFAFLLQFAPVFENPVFASTSWYDSNWKYRKEITINNSDNSETLTDYQVKVSLSSSTFDFSKAQSTGADIRFTDSDGTTLLNHWIESYDSSGQTATIWVKVPSIPASSTKTVYLYYGNSSASSISSGDNTFEFFDDFETPTSTSGYYTLDTGPTVLETTQGWETSAPHNLSVIEVDSGGYKYWGYYGLVSGNGAIGLARSNDLINWTKYDSNPLFTNGRWPSVLKADNTFYMAYTKNYNSTPYIVLATSTDGINFTDLKTLVPAVPGYQKNNPNLFQDPSDGKYYLYYRDTQAGLQVRGASAIEDLDNAIPSSIGGVGNASPNMFYRDNTYFLMTEWRSNTQVVWSGIWHTILHQSSSPTTGFTQVANNPILTDDHACSFQYEFDNTLYLYSCKLTGSTWSVVLHTADLSVGRTNLSVPPSSKWTNTTNPSSWQVVDATQQDGTVGGVLSGYANNKTLLYSTNYTGSDYIIEVNGQQVTGRVWGIGARSNQNVTNQYTGNLYEDLDATNNLYLYRWGPNSVLKKVAIGVVSKSTWYKMKLVVNESSLELYIDDELKASASDSTFSSGNVGVYTEGSSVETTQVYINDFLVRQYISPEPSASLGSEEIDPTAPTGSVVINSGNSYTTSTSVTLTISAADNVDPASSIQMQVSNNSDFSEASWESYAASKSWTLTSGDGTKTVYIRFKDSDGNISSTYSDSIIYDTTRLINNLPKTGQKTLVIPSLILLSFCFILPKRKLSW